jgi:hypothetical protein
MTNRKNPPKEPFRRMQVVSPVPSKRRYGTGRPGRKRFDIYVTNRETGEQSFAITIIGPGKAEAEKTAKKLLRFSPLLRNITHASFTAVEVEE